jgi:hypothetical protein
MFRLGKRSKRVYDTLHRDLQLVIDESLKVSQVDFTLTEGERTAERQQMLYDTGKSKVNPRKYTPKVLVTKGKHIVNDYRKLSDAFDFIAAVPGRSDLIYDRYHLFYLVGVFTSVGKRLYLEGKISKQIRSGANWDMDGTLKYDQSFLDAPHVERF